MTETHEVATTEKPEIDDAPLEAAGKKVEGLEARYDPEGRPTVVVEGTDGMVSGTAFAHEPDEQNSDEHKSDDEDERKSES